MIVIFKRGREGGRLGGGVGEEGGRNGGRGWKESQKTKTRKGKIVSFSVSDIS